jgi:hypothetical protein
MATCGCAQPAAGSATALDEAYDRHAAAAHGLALRITGDSRESAEITLDVFVELWQHPYRYTPGAVSPRGGCVGGPTGGRWITPAGSPPEHLPRIPRIPPG